MRVLVFDDEPAIGRFVCRVVETLGFVSDAVVDAREFQDRYRARLPDMIVLDLQIGPYDGIEQLRFLGAQDYPNPILLISGFDDRVLDVARQFGRQIGLNIVAALAKPLRADALRAVFEKIAAGKEKLTSFRVFEAIEQGELFLEYQPILTCSPRVMHQLEALVRWHHPLLGRIAPDSFIPLAEEADDIINALTDWVVTTSARDYKRLKEKNYTIPIAVNLSGKNLGLLDFPDRMQELLGDAGVPTSAICFEMTETVASANFAHSMDVLSRLRLKGFSLAIDDFGIGYSSLKRLRQLPFSTLKIDRSFVAEALSSRDSFAIVKSITDLAHNMELSTVAEGVENEKTAQLLERLGVDAFQGFHFARPMPLDDIPNWLGTQVFAQAG